MDPIAEAAKTARSLFLLNEWTWHHTDGVPTLLDIEATFSSLRWAIEAAHGDERGTTRFAATGRLLVVRTPSGDYQYTVSVGIEYAAVLA